MPRSATIIQVFVASPSDVKSERDTLELLIQELNHIWSKSLGIMFVLMRWETHTHPAFGTDPQAIINEQIGDDYDVFVGILWARFGTPTPRAASGTLEEFERALKRRRASGNSPDILLYFKDAPISPSEIDVEQLALVTSFKRSLSERGGLYASFNDASGFEASLRADLSVLARQYSAQLPQRDVTSLDGQLSVSVQPVSVRQLDEDEDDLGYLDYAEIFQSRMAEMTSTMDAIADATTKMAEQIVQRTEEIEKHSKNGGDARTWRKIVKLSAENMSTYAEVLEENIPLMASSRNIGFDALTNALAIYEDFSRNDNADLKDLHTGLHGLIQGASGANDQLSGFRTAMNALPRMTSEINKAKRAVVSQLDLMIAEINKTIQDAENINRAVEATL